MWDYKDNLDGLLEDKPYNHETVVIPAELPGVELEAVHTSVVTDVVQEEVDNNVAVDADYENYIIKHSSTTNTIGPGPASKTSGAVIVLTGTAHPDHPIYKEDNRDIEEVDIPVLEPAKIINVDTEEEHFQDTKNENPTNEPSNQPDRNAPQETYDVMVKCVDYEYLEENNE